MGATYVPGSQRGCDLFALEWSLIGQRYAID